MGLKDTIREVVEDFNKRKNKSEVWETLEKKLIKNGFKEQYNKMMNDMDSLEAYEFLKVWDAIEEHLNKKKATWTYKGKSFEGIKALSELDDVEDVIKILADSGYKLESYIDFPIPKTNIYLTTNDIKIFKTLAKDGLYKKYGLVFKALNKFGYKRISGYKNRYTQVDRLISLANLEGDAVGAIYVLVNNGYKIDDSTGISKLDIRSIKKITEEDEKEKTEEKDGIPIYLYNTGDAELFQDYFNSLETENKKSVLKSILEYETKQELQEQNKIRNWLEKSYEHMIREVGFEDVKRLGWEVKEPF